MYNPTLCLSHSYAFEVDLVNEHEWNGIVNLFDDAWIYNTWAYARVVWDGPFSHLVVKKDGLVVAAAQVRLMKIPFIGTRVAYLAWGPMWRPRQQPREPDFFRQVLRAIRLEYALRRRLFVRMKPNEVSGEDPQLLRILSEEGYSYQPNTKPFRTFICEIGDDLETLRMKMLHKKWREKLSRAQRNNLQIDLGNTDELYERFLEIYYEMHKRKGFIRFMDVEQFRQIQRLLPEEQKMRIGICTHEGKDIAALVYSTLGNRGLSIFSGTANDGLRLRGAYLLRWTMIEDLKTNGCTRSDQGGIDPVNNPGGYEFRVGLGGKDVHHIGQYDTWSNSFWPFVVRTADSARIFYNDIRKSINRKYRSMKGK